MNPKGNRYWPPFGGRPKSLVIVALLGILGLHAASRASFASDSQSRTPGAVQVGALIGRVVDGNGIGIRIANVLIVECSLGEFTNSSGHFGFFSVTPGIYSIQVRCPGYRTRANAICAVSAISSVESFGILRDFVWARFQGEVDEATFKALEAAIVTMGFTSLSQGPLVIEYLEKGANPDHWTGLPWSYSGVDPVEMQERFSRFCIHGLGYCSGPWARGVLLELLGKPYGKKLEHSIRSSLKTQESVTTLGLYEYERGRGSK